MLTEEKKEEIRQQNIAYLEKKHNELIRRMEAENSRRLESEKDRELERLRREEEDVFYANNPDYVKYTSSDGSTRWITREEFERKKYRRRKVRKRHDHSIYRKIWERSSIVIIIIGMIAVIVIAFKLVG